MLTQKEFASNFCASFRKLLKDRGMKQTELAEILGVNVHSVNRWATGVSLPDLYNYYAAMQVLRGVGRTGQEPTKKR